MFPVLDAHLLRIGWKKTPQQKYRQAVHAAHAAFENELRWDPTTKRYQRTGDLIRQGKLNNHTHGTVLDFHLKGG